MAALLCGAMAHETHVSAEQDRPQAPSRLPGAYGHRGGAKGARPTQGTRAQEAFRLNDACQPEDPVRPLRLERLKKRSEFLKAARGVRRTRDGLTLEICANSGLVPARIRVGFTASRKVGIAVVRNRARRRLRAVAAAVLPLYGNVGNDYVLVARAGTLTRPFDTLLGDLTAALTAAHAKLSQSQAGDLR